MSLMIVGACVTTASAAQICQSANITKVGVLPANQSATASKYTIRIDCVDDGATDALPWPGERMFMLTQELGDSGYATALTALSLNQPVYVKVESTKWWSLLSVLYVDSPPTP